MTDYYASELSADRLRRCYEMAPPRVRQYLEAEVEYVLSYLEPKDVVLELGCGYGRVLAKLAPHAGVALGIDTSRESLALAASVRRPRGGFALLQMDAARLGLSGDSIDAVVCVQNGISAFHVDPSRLVQESLRVTRPGGLCLFSSYSEKFWDDRLQWFRLQAEAGLVGSIDWGRTGDGTIVCEDGFVATTFGPDRFRALARELGVESRVEEVDASSVFCVMRKGEG